MISLDLRCENLKPIVKKLRVREWCYIMAPIDPTTYARARVLKQVKLGGIFFFPLLLHVCMYMYLRIP